MRRCSLPPAPSRKGRGRIAAFLVLWVCLDPASLGTACEARRHVCACGFAQSVHRPDAGAAGAGEDRRAVAAGARPRAVVRRAAGGAACRSCAPRPRRCCVCTRTWSWRRRTARRPRSRCCNRRASRCCASPCRTILPASAQMTRLLAATLGRAAARRGAARRDGRQARRAAAAGPRRSRALVWEPRGLTAGPGTLMDAVLRAAGLTNASDGRRVGPGGAAAAPARSAGGARPRPRYPSLATALLDHPALAGLPRRAIPPALTICAGPFSAEAAALLAR